MLTSGEINTIGQLLNSSWGSSFSTGAGQWPRGTTPLISIKGSLVTAADGSVKLVLTYTDFVSFRNDQEIVASKRRFRSLGENACSSFITNMKKKFKESSSRALKVKFDQDHDSVESIYNPTPAISLIGSPRYKAETYRGYYRYTSIYNIS